MERDTNHMLVRVERAIYVLAAVAAILGVGFWIWEYPDREEERSARQSELVGRANEYLSNAAATSVVDSYLDPGVGWAIETLARYRRPISVSAATVVLADISVDCASIEIEAETLRMVRSEVRNSTIQWSGKEARVSSTDMQRSIVYVRPQANGVVELAPSAVDTIYAIQPVSPVDVKLAVPRRDANVWYLDRIEKHAQHGGPAFKTAFACEVVEGNATRAAGTITLIPPPTCEPSQRSGAQSIALFKAIIDNSACQLPRQPFSY